MDKKIEALMYTDKLEEVKNRKPVGRVNESARFKIHFPVAPFFWHRIFSS